MTPFAIDTGAPCGSLFVPRDSALSQLELLTQSLGLDADGRQQDGSRGGSAAEDSIDLVPSSQQCDESMQWVLMARPEELERRLKVFISTTNLEPCLWLKKMLLIGSAAVPCFV
jgi:hypothetical protein